MKKIYFIKTISFVIVFMILLSGATFVLKSKWTNGTAASYIQEGLYDLEKDSVEVCFLGNSQLVYGISGMLMQENYGISTYTVATGLQPYLCTYFNLKEIEKKQNIKVAVMDVAGLYEKAGEVHYRFVWDGAPLSLNKLQNIWEYYRNGEGTEIWSYIFPIIQYHSRWNELEKKDFAYKEMNEESFRGNVLSGDIYPEVYYDELVVSGEEDETDELMYDYQLKYFQWVVDYCKEKGIELVLIKTPKSTWTGSRMLKVQELADEHGLEYIDFNEKELFDKIGFDTEQDFMDPDHLNARGSEKLTEYLAEFLIDRYEFEDIRETDKCDVKSTEDFWKDYSYKFLMTAKNVEDILKSMNNDRYEILIQKNGEISEYWTKEMQELFEEIGFKQDISELSGKKYVAHMYNGEVVYEECSQKAIEYDGVITDGRIVKLASGNENDEKNIAMSIGKKTVDITNGGMSILIYDREKGRVVRYFSIGFDDEKNGLTIR